MPQRHVSIGSSVGLHARPAGIFSRAVLATGVPVTIARDGGAPVDAGSLLMVMGLALRHGETAELAADGPRAQEVLDDLAGLLATDLDAPAAS